MKIRDNLKPTVALVSWLAVSSMPLFAQVATLPAKATRQETVTATAKPTPTTADSPFALASKSLEMNGATKAVPLEVRGSTNGDYILALNDTVQITVFREPDLTTDATVSRDGTIQVPLINDVKVGGMSVKQARDLIRKLYNAEYLVEPQVSVRVTKFADRKFTIIGQVNSPGTYTLDGGESINLIEAIGMAGGFTRIADRGRVVVKRISHGMPETVKVNAKAMAGSGASPMAIKPGDIISVGESWY